MARISLAFGLLLLVALSSVYEVQGTFLLRHYLRKIPRRSRDFQPFACKGMLNFVDVLQNKSPMTPQYKSFFGNLKSYMNFINSASGSKNYNSELKGKAQGLHSAITSISGKSGSSADSNKVMETLMSMGQTLGQQKQSGSTVMSFGQRKEMITSMAKWAQTIGQFVASSAAKNGKKIDVSSLGVDGIDASAAAGSGDSTATGGTSSTVSGGSSSTSSGSGTATGGSNSYGSDTATGGSNSYGSGTATGGSTATSSDTASGGSTATGSGTATGGSTVTGSGTATGGSSETGSVRGSYGSGGGSTQSSTNGGSQTSSCTTSKCSNGGGSSFKGSMNFKGQASSQSQHKSSQSQQGSSQQSASFDGSS